jgi:hypothetical protein
MLSVTSDTRYDIFVFSDMWKEIVGSVILKKIKMMIDENSDLIIRHWNRYFGKEENNED